MKPPHNVAYLEKALRAMAGSDESLIRLRRTLANVIAGQFLDGAVMRGGGSLKLRYGEQATRYTLCRRLFANRRKQPWPTEALISDEWRMSYEHLKMNLPVLPTADEAVVWVNNLISRIFRAIP